MTIMVLAAGTVWAEATSLGENYNFEGGAVLYAPVTDGTVQISPAGASYKSASISGNVVTFISKYGKELWKYEVGVGASKIQESETYYFFSNVVVAGNYIVWRYSTTFYVYDHTTDTEKAQINTQELSGGHDAWLDTDGETVVWDKGATIYMYDISTETTTSFTDTTDPGNDDIRAPHVSGDKIAYVKWIRQDGTVIGPFPYVYDMSEGTVTPIIAREDQSEDTDLNPWNECIDITGSDADGYKVAYLGEHNDTYSGSARPCVRGISADGQLSDLTELPYPAASSLASWLIAIDGNIVVTESQPVSSGTHHGLYYYNLDDNPPVSTWFAGYDDPDTDDINDAYDPVVSVSGYTARMAFHGWGSRSPDEVYLYTLSLPAPPEVSVTTPSGTQSGDVTISYTLTDAESDACSIAVQFSEDSGEHWDTAIGGTGGDGITGLSSSPTGVPHTYVWDSRADVSFSNQEDIRIKITPSDAAEGTADETENFTVNNLLSNVYVDGELGTDDVYHGTGTDADAFATVQYGIDAADEGGTINVAAGTYTITSAIDVNKGVTITGNTTTPANVVVKYSPASTTLNGFEIGAADITIQGFKIINCFRGVHFGRTDVTSTGCTINNCVFDNIHENAIGEVAAENTTISNNTITNCTQQAIEIRANEATDLANRTEVTGNTISSCSQACIQTYLGKYVYIYDNNISSTNDKGINIIRPNATGTSDRIQVIGNNISQTKYPGIQVIGAPYTYVYDNTLTQCNYYGADGTGDWDYASIHVADDTGPTYSHYTVIDNNNISNGINGVQIWSDNCTVTNNTIYDMGFTYNDEKIVSGRTYKNSAILVGTNWASNNIDPTGTTIENNSIHDNYWGLFHSADLTNGVPAENNYWGTINGPEHAGNTYNVGSQGDQVSDNVAYVPWWDAYPSGSSWGPVENPAASYYSSIQAAVDSASAGHTITCAAGTYHETHEHGPGGGVAVDIPWFAEGAGGLTIQSTDGPENTVIDCDMGGDDGWAADGVQIVSNDITFTGFTVQNAYNLISQVSGNDHILSNLILTYFVNYGISILAANDCEFNNLTIHGNDVSDSENRTVKGIDMQEYGSGGNSNNTFDDIIIYDIETTGEWGVSYGIYWEGDDTVDHPSNDNTFTNLTIYNIIGSYFARGLYLEAKESNAIENATFSGGSVYNVVDSDDTTPAGELYAWGIYIRGGVNNVSITGFDVTNCNKGIYVSHSTYPPSQNVDIHNNNIAGNTEYGVQDYDGDNDVDASANYWGDASGPDGEGPGTGDAVSANVDYSHWWGANYVGDPHTTAWTWYTNDSIQDAINAASATVSDVINVVAGTYNVPENPVAGSRYKNHIWINKPLSLIGEDPATTFIDGEKKTAGFQPGWSDPGPRGTVTISPLYSGTPGAVTVKNFTFINATTYEPWNEPHALVLLQSSAQYGGDQTIENCRFIGRDEAVMYEFLLTAWGLRNGKLVVKDNEFSMAGAAICEEKPSSNACEAEITGNYIHDVEFGILLHAPGGGPVAQKQLIVGNTLEDCTGSGTAITIGSAGTGEFTDVEIHFNNITGSGEYGINNRISSMIDATDNYWGALDGPGPVGTGSGDNVSVNVDYDPWLGKISEDNIYMEGIVEPQNQYYNTAPTFANFGFYAELGLNTIDFSTDGTNWTNIASSIPGQSWSEVGWTLPNFASLSEGAQTVSFRAYDDDGHLGGGAGVWDWSFIKQTVNIQAVTITDFSDPVDTGGHLNVEFEQAKGVAHYRLYYAEGYTTWPGDGSATMVDPATSPYDLVTTDETNYMVRVYWVDEAGNQSTNYDQAGPMQSINNSTVYVGTFNNYEFGTETYPYDTIGEGITNLSDEGTVNVAARTYNENVTINKSLTMNGAQHGVNPVGGRTGSESTIDGVTTTAVNISASNVVLDGFTITIANKDSLSKQAGVIIANNTSGLNTVTVKNNIIQDISDGSTDTSDNCTYGILTWGTTNGPSNIDILNTVIDSVEEYSIAINDKSSNVTIDGNSITNMFAAQRADGLLGVAIGIGGSSPGPSTVAITNNTLNTGLTGDGSTTDAGVGIGMAYAQTGVTVTNNEITVNSEGIAVQSTSSTMPVVNNNSITSNTIYGVHNYGTTLLVAENNWWGNNGGPDATNNPNGSPNSGDGGGDAVGDYVDAEPWIGHPGTPISPTENQVVTNPVVDFGWPDVAGATGYDIEVFDMGGNVVESDNNLISSQVQYTLPTTNASYQWHTRAYVTGGYKGDPTWGDMHTFLLNADSSTTWHAEWTPGGKGKSKGDPIELTYNGVTITFNFKGDNPDVLVADGFNFGAKNGIPDYFDIICDLPDGEFDVDITMPFDNTRFTGHSLLGMYYESGSDWIALATGVLTTTTLTANTDHFTNFSVIDSSTAFAYNVPYPHTPDSYMHSDEICGLLELVITNKAGLTDTITQIKAQAYSMCFQDYVAVSLYNDVDDDGVFEPYGDDSGGQIATQSLSLTDEHTETTTFSGLNIPIADHASKTMFVAYTLSHAPERLHTLEDVQITVQGITMTHSGTNLSNDDLNPSVLKTVDNYPPVLGNPTPGDGADVWMSALADRDFGIEATNIIYSTEYERVETTLPTTHKMYIYNPATSMYYRPDSLDWNSSRSASLIPLTSFMDNEASVLLDLGQIGDDPTYGVSDGDVLYYRFYPIFDISTNQNNSSSYTFTMDMLAPTISNIEHTGVDNYYRAGETVTITFDVADAQSGVDTLVASNPTLTMSGETAGSASFVSYASGTYTYDYVVPASGKGIKGGAVTVTITGLKDFVDNETTTGNVATDLFFVERTIPIMSAITFDDTDAYNYNGAFIKDGDTFTFTSTVTADYPSASASDYHAMLDKFGLGVDVVATSYAAGVATWTGTIGTCNPANAQDSNFVRVWCFDLAGNESLEQNDIIPADDYPNVVAGGLTSDNTDPTGNTATPYPAVITDSCCTTKLGFTLDIVFNDDMNQNVDPIISFNPDVLTSGPLTWSFGSWTSSTTYTAIYAVTDNNEEIDDIDVIFTGAKDKAGNLQSPDPQTIADVFDIDTKNPTVSLVTYTPSIITDAAAGTKAFSITIDYDETMDQSVAPTVTLTANSTLTPHGDSGWFDGDTYMAWYDVDAAGNDQLLIDVDITNAKDFDGNTQNAYHADDAFEIDTKNPISSATSATYNTGTGDIDVPWTAFDASGIARVVLWARKDAGGYAAADTCDTPPATDGTFYYPLAPASAEGTYDFYTIATDVPGNVEDAPVTPDASETVDVVATKFNITTTPTSPTVGSTFIVNVEAVNAIGLRDLDYTATILFDSNYPSYVTLPNMRTISNGYGTYDNCMATTELTDLVITVYDLPNGVLESTSALITVGPAIIAPPTAWAGTDTMAFDVPDDQGGWIYLDYTMSINDAFHSSAEIPYIDYYVVERFSKPDILDPAGAWQAFAFLGCYNAGSDSVTALLESPASDSLYPYRMAAVYIPGGSTLFGNNDSSEPIAINDLLRSKGSNTHNKDSRLASITKMRGARELFKEQLTGPKIVYAKDAGNPKDSGYQSDWANCGSAAAKDDLPAYADMKVFLEGPYQTGGTMANDLYTAELLPVGAPANAVDVITVELRTTTTGATVKTADAYLSTDGYIISANGEKSLPFYYTTGIEYYLVILHRNHLAIMSDDTYKFGDSVSQAPSIDLTTVGTAYLNGFKLVEPDVYALYTGDANADGNVNTMDLNHPYWRAQTGSAGYKSADFNLDSQVNTMDLNYPYWRANTGKSTSVPDQTKNSNNNKNVLKDSRDNGSKDDVGITFTFANGYLAPDKSYYEFDVMAKASATGTKIGSGIVYLNYSTAGFGENIHDNGNVTVTKGTLTTTEGPTLYSIIPNDNTSSRFAVTFEYTSATGWGNSLPTTPTDLIHVKIDIVDDNQTAGLSFENSLMTGCQFYDDNVTIYAPVTATDTDDSTLPVELSTFTAQYLDKIPVLYWETESETDNMGWFVYRNNEDDFTNAQKVSEFLDGNGTTTEKSSYTHEDTIEDPKSGDVYYYWLESIDYGGIVHRYNKVAQLTIPDQIDPGSGQIPRPEIFGLFQNVPNPFVNGTRISFNLHQTAQVELKIYNIKGELVKDLYSGISDYKSLQWNGTDDTGKQLSPGIYLYNLTVNGKSQEIKKLILMR